VELGLALTALSLVTLPSHTTGAWGLSTGAAGLRLGLGTGAAGLGLGMGTGAAGLVLGMGTGAAGLRLGLGTGAAGLGLGMGTGAAGLVLGMGTGAAGLGLGMCTGAAGLVLSMGTGAAGLVLGMGTGAAGLVLGMGTGASGLGLGTCAVGVGMGLTASGVFEARNGQQCIHKYTRAKVVNSVCNHHEIVEFVVACRIMDDGSRPVTTQQCYVVLYSQWLVKPVRTCIQGACHKKLVYMTSSTVFDTCSHIH
jgi:hypothetical protein